MIKLIVIITIKATFIDFTVYFMIAMAKYFDFAAHLVIFIAITMARYFNFMIAIINFSFIDFMRDLAIAITCFLALLAQSFKYQFINCLVHFYLFMNYLKHYFHSETFVLAFVVMFILAFIHFNSIYYIIRYKV